MGSVTVRSHVDRYGDQGPTPLVETGWTIVNAGLGGAWRFLELVADLLNVGRREVARGTVRGQFTAPPRGPNPPAGISFTPGLPRTLMIHARSTGEEANMRTRILNAPTLLGVLVFATLSARSPDAIAAAPAPTPAAPARPQAPSDLLKAGQAKYEAGDYGGALADFESAESRQVNPEAARWVGLCQDKLGHLREAASAYQRFLAAPPPRLAGEVGGLVKRIEEIRATPGNVHIESVPAGAMVTIDGALQTQPTPIDVSLAPGKHLIHLKAPEREAIEREVDVAFASTQGVAIQLTETSASAATAESRCRPSPGAFAPCRRLRLRSRAIPWPCGPRESP